MNEVGDEQVEERELHTYSPDGNVKAEVIDPAGTQTNPPTRTYTYNKGRLMPWASAPTTRA